MFISATAALAFLTTVGSTVTSSLSSKLPPSATTFSWTPRTVPNTATVLRSSAVPITLSDGRAPNESNNSSSLSEEERRRYMAWLQEDTKQKLIPTMIYLATLAVVGLLGNSLVLTVYSKKARKSATDIFIMAIAVSDLMANLLAIPGEIYDTFHFWDAHQSLLCKFRVFLNALTAVTSGHLLFAVALCRYRKICRPHGKQTSMTNAKIMSVVIALVCSLYSVPTAIVYGIQTTPTPRADVLGKRCFTDDKYVNTLWPMLNSGFLTLLFFGFGIPLTVLYALIGIQAWRHRTFITQINQTTSTYSEEDTDGKPKAFCCFRQKNQKKKKVCIVLGNSSNEGEVGSEKGAKITGKPAKMQEQKSMSENEESSVDEVDDYCYTSRTRLWTAPVANLTSEELSLRLAKIREWGLNKVENVDTKEEAGKLRSESLNENALVLECSNALNEGKKTEEQDGVTDECTYRKGRSQSLTISGKKILRQKGDGTLSGTRKERDGNVAHNEMDDPPNGSKMTPPTVADCENNQTTFNLTVTETNTDDECKTGLKRSNLSFLKNLSNVNLKPKYDTNKKNIQRTGLTRTTLMLIIISAIFFIAFLPYLLLMSCTYMVPNFRENMSGAGFALYNVFLRFYFVNSAANAIIYSLCDIRFRNQVKQIMRTKFLTSSSLS